MMLEILCERTVKKRLKYYVGNVNICNFIGEIALCNAEKIQFFKIFVKKRKSTCILFFYIL